MSGHVRHLSDITRCADCGKEITRRRLNVCADCYRVEVTTVGQPDGDSPNILRGGAWVLDPVRRIHEWKASE